MRLTTNTFSTLGQETNASSIIDFNSIILSPRKPPSAVRTILQAQSLILEATAEAEDDECEEDLLAISREFNLLELIEDELLMAMPPVPMHDICPVQPKMTAVDADFEALGQEGKPNPFAALAALKGKK